MATYAIGDVHGCFDTLEALLRRLRYDSRHDHLWFVGDLVNSGPRSLATVRWAVEQDDRIVAVLGNHDLHLLARAEGTSRPKRRDSLDEILHAPDREHLLAWLVSRPLLHRQDGHCLVHAGLFPEWSLERAEELARETEAALQAGMAGLIASIDQKTEERWQEGLERHDRVRIVLAGFARLRTLREDGRMCAEFSGPPEEAPNGCRAWFEVPERASRGETVICGHWAALGLRIQDGVAAIDTACVYGKELTALRLDDGQLFQQPAID
jgi:bis(5'-nucleosyl)-tetraphosphatase (symmetrical)